MIDRNIIFTYYYGSAQSGKCKCCGKTNINRNGNDWERSHIQSRKKNGSDNAKNIVPCCTKCNREMGTKNLKKYMLEKYNRTFDKYYVPIDQKSKCIIS